MLNLYSKQTIVQKAKAVVAAHREQKASDAERLAALAVKAGVKPYGDLCVSVVLGTDEYRIVDAAHQRIILAELDARQERGGLTIGENARMLASEARVVSERQALDTREA